MTFPSCDQYFKFWESDTEWVWLRVAQDFKNMRKLQNQTVIRFDSQEPQYFNWFKKREKNVSMSKQMSKGQLRMV